jgi:hypothetical protein
MTQTGRTGVHAELDRDLVSTKITLVDAAASPFDPLPYEEDEVKRVMVAGAKTVKPENFQVDPYVFRVDVLEKTEEIERLNGDYKATDGATYRRRWSISLGADERMRSKWYCKWPGKLHVNDGKVHHIDLLFQTASESITIEQFYPILSSHEQVIPPVANKEGHINLTLNRMQLQKLFASTVTNTTDNYHIIPLKIEIQEEDSNLPVFYHAKLTARLPSSETSLMPWSTPAGGHAQGSGEHSTDSFHHIIAPRQRITSSAERKTLFVADAKYNTPEYSRWINVDKENLLRDLDNSISSKNSKLIEVATPGGSGVIPLSILQFVVMDEWERLVNICNAKGDPQPKITPLEHRGNERFFVVPLEAVRYVIQDHLRSIDRDRMIMRLEDLTLRLQPLKGKKELGQAESIGMTDIRALARPIRNAFTIGDIGAPGFYPRYYARIRISYEIPTHDRKNQSQQQQQQSGFMSPMSISHPKDTTPSPNHVVWPSFGTGK